MRGFAKWTVIVWSAICLFGLVTGMAEVGEMLNEPMDEYEEAGAGIGIGCGMFMWFIIWAVIAVPALVIWSVSGKKENDKVQEKASLCSSCGKYFSGSPKFCPNCGHEV